MNFQENLRKYREAAGYSSAKEFADKLGINYTTYIAYEDKDREKPREPRYDTLCKIAAALGVSVDDLLGYQLSDYGKYLRILLDVGFTILPDNRPGEDSVNIGDMDDNFYHIPKDVFMKVMAEAPHTTEYQEAIYKVYRSIFKEVEKIELNAMTKALLTDPQYEDIRKRLAEINDGKFLSDLQESFKNTIDE